MAKGKTKNGAPIPTTDEGAITELGSMAWDLARQRLADGTATSQLITFVLKQASPKEKLERELLQKQVALTEAKTQDLKDSKDIKKMYADAMSAFKDYLGYQEGEEPK